MGVIRLYAEIIKDYPDIIKKKIDKIDHLYIDFNAIVYNTISLLTASGTQLLVGCENILIKATVESLINLITTIDPKKSVMIAVDGAAPAGKMVQQRDRRYKSILESKFKELIHKKHGSVYSENKWSTAHISPGTPFMFTLESEIKKGLVGIEKKGLDIEFNTCDTPGEGEHKIIKKIKNYNLDQDDTHLVHSPDNDLIVLLSVVKKNVYLIRNEDQDLEKPFVFVDIQLFITTLFKEYNQELSQENRQRFAEDYSFLTFFFGNDFIKAVPYLKIKERNTDLLFKIYQDTKEQLKDSTDCYLTNGNKINTVFLSILFSKLGQEELRLLKNTQRKRHYITKTSASPDFTGKSLKEKLEIEINNFSHAMYYDHKNPFFEDYNYLFSKIDYYSPNYIEQYNDYYFKGHNMNDVRREYIKSFQYTLNYYTGNVDQMYYYKYRAAPLFIQIKEQDFKSMSNEFNFNTRPFTHVEQLFLILPMQLLVSDSFSLKKIFDSIPNKLKNKYALESINLNKKLDTVQGTKYIYSSLMLNDLYIPEILELNLS